MVSSGPSINLSRRGQRSHGQDRRRLLLERLHQWGVRRIFGYPGDGINGLLGALHRADGKIEFIQVRHEEMAAFMASAYAKFTGELGVCIATSGPGASHLITGLYDARLDHMPVLAITGQQARTALGGHYQQEVDLPSMFKDVAGAFVQQATAPAQVRHLVDRAIRIALGERRVTALIVLPNDLQEARVRGAAAQARHAPFGRRLQPNRRSFPTRPICARAADVLNAGKKVAILVGAGALHATDEVIAVADRLRRRRRQGAARQGGAAGRPALGHRLDRPARHQAELGADDGMRHAADDRLGLSLFGVPAEGGPGARRADRHRARHAEPALSDGGQPGRRCRRDAARAAAAAASRRPTAPGASAIETERREWWKTLEERAMQSADPVNPQRVAWELSPRLPERAIITSDSGSCANWYARDLKIRRGMMCSLSGGLASMGAAVPYAIAAKFAHPDRPVIALVGDGAMQMNNMAELITVAKYWRRLVQSSAGSVCVFNNEDLNQVTWEQRVHGGRSEVRRVAADSRTCPITSSPS